MQTSDETDERCGGSDQTLAGALVCIYLAKAHVQLVSMCFWRLRLPGLALCQRVLAQIFSQGQFIHFRMSYKNASQQALCLKSKHRVQTVL